MAKKTIIGLTSRFWSGLILIALAFAIYYLRPFQDCSLFGGIPIISYLTCTAAGGAVLVIFSAISVLLLLIGVWRVITQ